MQTIIPIPKFICSGANGNILLDQCVGYAERSEAHQYQAIPITRAMHCVSQCIHEHDLFRVFRGPIVVFRLNLYGKNFLACETSAYNAFWE